MKIIKQYEDGPVLIQPNVFKDDRGYFYESFNENEFKEKVFDTTFVQDNQSRSAYGTIRGMHFQKGEYAQAKLVRVVKGAVVDVVVDIRPDSKHYLETYYAYLSDKNHYQFFVPRGFAHGFIALEDDTIFQYKCDNYYNKESEGSFNFKSIKDFAWGLYVPEDEWKVSPKDKDAPYMEDVNFASYGFTGLSKVKKYKELDLNLIKNYLTPSFSNTGREIDRESIRKVLMNSYVQFKDGREGKIIDTQNVYNPAEFFGSISLLVHIDGEEYPIALKASGFDSVLRIYLK